MGKEKTGNRQIGKWVNSKMVNQLAGFPVIWYKQANRQTGKPCNKSGFTLIERVSRLILERCNLLKSRPYQFPIQVGSLTTNVSEQSDMLMRSGKDREGKSIAPIDSSSGVPRDYHKGIKGKITLNSSYWQGKRADCRTTNYVSLVKVTQPNNGLAGEWKGRATVLLAKSVISGVVMGRSTQRPSRGKSRRYALKQLSGNWRDPNKFPINLGKEGYKACRLKLFPMFIRESEMLIVALIQRVSKAFWSEGFILNAREGALAFSSLLGGRSV